MTTATAAPAGDQPDPKKKPSPATQAQRPAGPALSNFESVIALGDLAKLTAEQRILYYHRVCESVGLNPLTQPFQYITLSGRLTLYATKGATDQLRKINGVSILRLEESEAEGILFFRAYARDRDGREDVDEGWALAITSNGTRMKGTELANARLKALSKAKRRVTLSICGLGLLDESEVADLSGGGAGMRPIGRNEPRAIAHQPQAQADLGKQGSAPQKEPVAAGSAPATQPARTGAEAAGGTEQAKADALAKKAADVTIEMIRSGVADLDESLLVSRASGIDAAVDVADDACKKNGIAAEAIIEDMRKFSRYRFYARVIAWVPDRSILATVNLELERAHEAGQFAPKHIERLATQSCDRELTMRDAPAQDQAGDEGPY